MTENPLIDTQIQGVARELETFIIEKRYGDALLQGIQDVKTNFFCIFNADGSFNPIELKNMYDHAIKGNADFIFGSRYMNDALSEDDTIVTIIGNFKPLFL